MSDIAFGGPVASDGSFNYRKGLIAQGVLENHIIFANQVVSWTGLFVASGTPKPVVDRLNAELVKAARDPSYRAAMNNIGVEAASSSPEAFASFVRAEMNKWAQVVQITGTKVD